MTIEQMITYLQQNYGDRKDMPINFTLLTPEDMFWALQRIDVIDENQEYGTYQQDKPLEYELFLHYWVEDVLAGYDFSWNFFDMVEDHYVNWYNMEHNYDYRVSILTDYLMEQGEHTDAYETRVFVMKNYDHLLTGEN